MIEQSIKELFLAMKRTEYAQVLRRMSNNDYTFPDLIEAHLTPCTEDQASAIFNGLKGIMQVDLKFGRRSGICHFNGKTGRYLISLPPAKTGRLRVGIVIHELAHVFDHTKRGRFGHGWPFVRAFEHLLDFNWRKFMPADSSVIEIFNRHRGPYSIMLTLPKGSKTVRVQGPMSAERAHKESIAHITSGDATESFVMSDYEGAFIGAFYKRGTEYRSWEDELGRMELRDVPRRAADPEDETALVPEREEPVPPVVAVADSSVPDEPLPGSGPVRDLPPEAPAKQPAKQRVKRATPPAPKPRVGLTIGEDDGWPKSEAAQAVHSLFGRVEDGRVLTSPEICEALGPQLETLGVKFPASLVSRLKQNGFLKEMKS